jgi:hypothetical protein
MKIKKKYKVVIDRSKWRTGSTYDSYKNDEVCHSTGLGDTSLLNKEGFKCCLGFMTQQITRRKISDIADPSDCPFSVPYLNKLKDDCRMNTDLASRAIEINDDESTTLPEKESALKELFKDTPISLRFKGKPVYRDSSV